MNLSKITSAMKSDLIRKYGLYVLLLIGLVFIAFGDFEKDDAALAISSAVESESTISNAVYVEEMQNRLSRVLSQISGAGSVEVMVTLSSGAQTIVASDEKISENTTHNGDGTTKSQTINKDIKVTTLQNQPLVIQELEPKIEGVVVVADGAKNNEVALQINQAVVALTGVKPHKVVVLNKKTN